MAAPFVVEVVAGESLPAKDTSITLKRTSDSYVTVALVAKDGTFKGSTRRSLTKHNTLDPVWRFLCDFVSLNAPVSVVDYSSGRFKPQR